MDARLALLTDWLGTLPGHLAIQPESLQPASSDASFRRYFRVSAPGVEGGALILMDAPPPAEDCAPFVHAAQVLARAGVTVPAIFASDLTQGFLALEDFGQQTYLDQLSPALAPTLYGAAMKALVTLQSASAPDTFAPYDAVLLRRELDLFPTWFLERHHGLVLTQTEHAALASIFTLLIDHARAQPQVYVHRDFHSRNLMVLPTQRTPGILDFQDAVYGPITYDLASLLRDAYIAWDEEHVLDGVARYWEQARKAGLPVTTDFGAFYRDFEWMGLQRHLKVLGIFARLYHRDGKDRYLADLPRVLKYVEAVVNRYEALTPLSAILSRLNGPGRHDAYTF